MPPQKVMNDFPWLKICHKNPQIMAVWMDNIENKLIPVWKQLLKQFETLFDLYASPIQLVQMISCSFSSESSEFYKSIRHSLSLDIDGLVQLQRLKHYLSKQASLAAEAEANNDGQYITYLKTQLVGFVYKNIDRLRVKFYDMLDEIQRYDALMQQAK